MGRRSRGGRDPNRSPRCQPKPRARQRSGSARLVVVFRRPVGELSFEGATFVRVRVGFDEIGEVGEGTADMRAGSGGESGHDCFPVQRQCGDMAASFPMVADFFESRLEQIEPRRSVPGFFRLGCGREFEPSPLEETANLLFAEPSEDLANADLTQRLDPSIDRMRTLYAFDSSSQGRGYPKSYDRTLDCAAVEPDGPSQSGQVFEVCNVGLARRIHARKKGWTHAGIS